MALDKKYIIALLPIIVLGFIFYYFADIVAYIALAWVLSMVGAPLMTFFKKFFGRTFAAVLTLFTFTMLFSLLIWVFVPSIVSQAKNLAGIDYESVVNSIEEPVQDWNNWMVEKGFIPGPVHTEVEDESQPTQERESIITEVVRVDSLLLQQGDSSYTSPIAIVINVDPNNLPTEADEESADALESGDFSSKISQSIFKFLDPSRITGIFGSIFGLLSNFFVGFMSVFFIAFFFLREQGLFYNMISAIVPNDHEGHVSIAIEETSKMLVRYFVGMASQITVITIAVSLALSLLGIKNALLIGFFAALMNVIPYIGPILGASFGVAITVSSNLDVSFYDQMLPMILKVLAVFFGMQLFDNFIVQPNIFSKSVKAHPLEIFIVVLVGAKLGGMLGMVLAIPVYTVLRVLASVFLSEYKIVQRMTASLTEEETEEEIVVESPDETVQKEVDEEFRDAEDVWRMKNPRIVMRKKIISIYFNSYVENVDANNK